MNEIQELQTQHYRGRAKNAVQNFLVRKLYIPKVYLDASWNGVPVDVLAVDRDGSGDVHAVNLVLWESGHTDDHGWSAFLDKAVSAAISDFTDFPVHFRYLAVVCSQANKHSWRPNKGVLDQSLAPDGVGRVGILYVNVTEEDPTVEVLLKPERFRSTKEIIELADRFVAESTANWEVRE